MELANITPAFFSRYFEKNAEQRYAMQLLEFMLWRRGRFIPPMHKARVQQSFIQQEVEDYKKGIINIPQLQFLVTTRCSLRCINCNAYIPYFGTHGKNHKDLSPQEFKQDLDKLSEAVTHIRRFILIGGEPLLHKELSSLIEIAAQSSMISLIEIITNGTIVPSSVILDTIERYKEKIYFHISNYQDNPALTSRLKHEKIFGALKERDIKCQRIKAGQKKFLFKVEVTMKLLKRCSPVAGLSGVSKFVTANLRSVLKRLPDMN